MPQGQWLHLLPRPAGLHCAALLLANAILPATCCQAAHRLSLRPRWHFAPLSCRLSLLLPFSLSKHVSSCCRPAGGVSSAALWLAALGLWALFQPS